MMDAREVALHVLREAQKHPGRELKKLLDDGLQATALAEDDRRLATELVYGTTRWRRRLDAIIDRLAAHPGRVSRKARPLLRMGVYQLLMMDRVPPYAAIHETVDLAKRCGVHSGFVNAILRSIQRGGDPISYPEKARDPVAHLALRYSYPDWIVARWIARYGVEEAEARCVAYNEPAPLSLRVNRLRATREALMRELESAGALVTPGAYTETAIHAGHLPSLEGLPPFQEGRCTVQDESSQLVTELLDPQPGEFVLDLCAAPGGKTTHIAETMGGRGRVVACDVAEEGLERVRENVARLGLKGIELRLQDAREPVSEFFDRADRVLVDAPCSALGILRRHAEARWQKREQDARTLAARQTRILDNAARYVKPGGILVYAVCTDTPEETEAVVATFRGAHPEFVIETAARLSMLPPDAVTREGALLLSPDRHRTDGFFAVRFRRGGAPETRERRDEANDE